MYNAIKYVCFKNIILDAITWELFTKDHGCTYVCLHVLDVYLKAHIILVILLTNNIVENPVLHK